MIQPDSQCHICSAKYLAGIRDCNNANVASAGGGFEY